MQKSASVLRKWIESQDPFRLYPADFNPKDYRIPMETGVSRKIILRVWASGTTALRTISLIDGTLMQQGPDWVCLMVLDLSTQLKIHGFGQSV